MWSSGAVEPLPLAARLPKTYVPIDALYKLGRRKLADMVRAMELVSFVHIESEVLPIDPELRSFVNLNERPQGKDLRPRSPLSGTVSVTRSFTMRVTKLPITVLSSISTRSEEEARTSYLMLSVSSFWRGVLAEYYGRVAHDINAIVDAAESFESEAGAYKEVGLNSLAAHALLDAARCWQVVEEFEKARRLDSEARSLFDAAGL